MPLCGQKTATACALLSVWGIIQLGLTGLASYLHSPALVEDLQVPEKESWTAPELARSLETAYETTALNCWIASLLYLCTLCLSAHQFWSNYRAHKDQFKAERF